MGYNPHKENEDREREAAEVDPDTWRDEKLIWEAEETAQEKASVARKPQRKSQYSQTSRKENQC